MIGGCWCMPLKKKAFFIQRKPDFYDCKNALFFSEKIFNMIHVNNFFFEHISTGLRRFNHFDAFGKSFTCCLSLMLRLLSLP